MRRSEPKDAVQITCLRRIRETAKAELYKLADGSEVWFPKSVIEDIDEMDDGTCVIAVSQWFAQKEGLEP